MLKRPFPLHPGAGEQAATAADAGVVEQKMDLVVACCSVISSRKRLSCPRWRHRRHACNAQALRQPFDSQSRFVSAIASAERRTSNIAALGDELRASRGHARAAPGDDSDLSGKILQGIVTFRSIVRVAGSEGLKIPVGCGAKAESV